MDFLSGVGDDGERLRLVGKVVRGVGRYESEPGASAGSRRVELLVIVLEEEVEARRVSFVIDVGGGRERPVTSD